MSGSVRFDQVHPDFQRELAGFAHVSPASRPRSVANALGTVTVVVGPSKTEPRDATAEWLTKPVDFPKELSKGDAEQRGLRVLRVSILPTRDSREAELWLNGARSN